MFLTILYVADLARARAFYDAVFGFRTTVDVPVYVEYRVNASTRLGLMPQGNTRHFLVDKLGKTASQEVGAARKARSLALHRSARHDGCPHGEIYLRLRNAKAALANLTKLGAKCTSPWAKRDWGDFAAYFLDPDGYVLVVAKRQQL